MLSYLVYANWNYISLVEQIGEQASNPFPKDRFAAFMTDIKGLDKCMVKQSNFHDRLFGGTLCITGIVHVKQ